MIRQALKRLIVQSTQEVKGLESFEENAGLREFSFITNLPFHRDATFHVYLAVSILQHAMRFDTSPQSGGKNDSSTDFEDAPNQKCNGKPKLKNAD